MGGGMLLLLLLLAGLVHGYIQQKSRLERETGK